MRAFYRRLTERLRHSPGPAEWAIEGSRLQSGPQPGNGNTRTHQYLCELKSVTSRMPLIQKLLEEHEFEGDARVYREVRSPSAWRRIWPEDQNA